MNRRGYEDTPKDVFFTSCAYPEDTRVVEHLIFRIQSRAFGIPNPNIELPGGNGPLMYVSYVHTRGALSVAKFALKSSVKISRLWP